MDKWLDQWYGHGLTFRLLVYFMVIVGLGYFSTAAPIMGLLFIFIGLVVPIGCFVYYISVNQIREAIDAACHFMVNLCGAFLLYKIVEKTDPIIMLTLMILTVSLFAIIVWIRDGLVHKVELKHTKPQKSHNGRLILGISGAIMLVIILVLFLNGIDQLIEKLD